MSCRGVFFSLTEAQTAHLLALTTDQQRREYIQNDIEGVWDQDHLLETDKAWDAIHRCLADGTLNTGPMTNPLAQLILGGTHLYSDKHAYIINFIHADELPLVSEALRSVTEPWMRSRYHQLKNTDYPPECISEEDWQYTWEYFSEIPGFIAQAASEHRSVIFTVDQ